jgi:5-methylcytosine-specific restriction protein A
MRRSDKPNRQHGRGLHTGSPTWRAIRREILLRDAYTCQHCGRYGDEVDHISGDSHDQRPENLQTLCTACHARKTRQQAHERDSRRPRITIDGSPEGWT